MYYRNDVYPCHCCPPNVPYRYFSYINPGFYPSIRNVPMDNTWHEPLNRENRIILKDNGKQPFVINIEEAAEQNNTFRTALWTGDHLQVTLMSINVGEDIGLEIHSETDQFLRIEEGPGIVEMGNAKDHLTFRRNIHEDIAIMVPAGTWHNITNTGNKPLKLYSIYAPPHHAFGTIEQTKADAMAAEQHQ